MADTASKLRYHGPSARPAEVIAVGCSLVSSSVHQCMYGCVRAAQKAPKTRASCMMAQKAARLARWLGRRARTAEPPARPRAPQSHPHGEHHAYEEGARGAAQARGRGRRGGGVKALALPGAACCLKEHARRAGRDSFMIKDAKSETTVGWQITRGFQIWSQKCRARSVAPAKVCRARQFIRRFNHSSILAGRSFELLFSSDRHREVGFPQIFVGQNVNGMV